MIGRGATAIVFKVKHRKEGTLMALKTIDRTQINLKGQRRLKKEVSIHLKTQHRHIIGLQKCF